MFELGTGLGEKDEFAVSGREFQSRGPMKEKALLPNDDRTYSYGRSCRNRM